MPLEGFKRKLLWGQSAPGTGLKSRPAIVAYYYVNNMTTAEHLKVRISSLSDLNNWNLWKVDYYII